MGVVGLADEWVASASAWMMEKRGDCKKWRWRVCRVIRLLRAATRPARLACACFWNWAEFAAALDNRAPSAAKSVCDVLRQAPSAVFESLRSL
jgi:hypothetical protein